MDRETRKANLKKLQLPKSLESKQQRTTRQTKNHNPSSAISNYFISPENRNNKYKNKEDEDYRPQTTTTEAHNNNDNFNRPDRIGSPIKKTTKSHSKRTKLDDFIFKDPKNIPTYTRKDTRKSINDDFVVPQKRIKKAPKLASSICQAQSSKVSKTRKKQTTIKSAFLRNEQMFAEIAAQHCAVDQFNGDEVQLALAISKSDAESKGITGPNEEAKDAIHIEDCNLNSDLIRDQLLKYGFRTAEKKDYNTFAAAFLPNAKRLKSKWANKFTALTLRQPEIQFKKLQNNIDIILSSNFRTKTSMGNEQIIPKYKLHSSLLKQSFVEGKNIILHNFNEENKPNELFFVKELFEINILPADYLLKDWSAIQGRDLTPKTNNTQYKERLQKLEYVYQELEEYFKSKKCLNWSDTNHSLGEPKEGNVPEASVAQHNENLVEINEKKEKKENVELNEMIELIQEVQKNNIEIESTEFNSTTLYNKKIKVLLPTTETLSNMEVSGCSLNTQATINTTQKTRSNSPDLFADSDVEMEETPKADNNNENLATNSTLCVIDCYSSNCNMENKNFKADDIKDSSNNATKNVETGVTTYEIFSSDEVKNISSLTLSLNKSTKQESFTSKSNINIGEKIIDLTQDEMNNHDNNKFNYNLNQSKFIEEVDLFAESPLKEEHYQTDINSSPEQSTQVQKQKSDTIELTKRLRSNKNSKSIKRDTFLYSLCSEIKDQKHDFTVDSLSIEEQLNSSSLTFESFKHLPTSFQKAAANIEKRVSKESLTDNDALFRELCNKYLNDQNNSFSLKRQNADNGKSFSQSYANFTMDFNISTGNNLKQKMDFGKSFTQFLHKIPTPQESTTYMNITKNFDMTPKTAIDFNMNLSKSQSVKYENLNVSIDLTQHDQDTGDSDLVDENDDCLILSDDEINYSIWQANKTDNYHTSEQSDMENEVISIPDVDHSSDEENKKTNDFLAAESYSDFEILNSKYSTRKEFPQEEPKFDRSEFGILEEYSQPIDDYTPNFCTPTKVLMDVSFLTSPTEKSAPMKFYSNYHTSSQKFQDLLKNIDEQSPLAPSANTLDDFDEFDRLVYACPSKTKRNPIKKPKDIEKLLTAEISFTEKVAVSENATKNLDALTNFSSDVEEIKCNNKTYKIRYVTTPKPDYTQFTEAELLKELYNFGIKPLKRKQAVKMLEYIYIQTHPILKHETVENNESATKENEQSDDKNFVNTFDQPCYSKSIPYSSNLKTSETNENVLCISNSSNEIQNFSETVNVKLKLHDSCGQDMLRYSDTIKAEMCNEIYFLQTNVTKKTPRPLLPFHVAWYNLVCSNSKLHETILMYEPIDLQEIYLFLKGLGYRYDPKDMKTFFDQRCIIFRYDLTPATKEVNRHVRKSKKN